MKNLKRSLKIILRQIRERLSALQEDQFDKGEKKLAALMQDEAKGRIFPVPTFLLMIMIWTYILSFPLILLLDPSSHMAETGFFDALTGFYVPLLSTMLIYALNQRLLVPRYFFKKRYAVYFFSNALAFVFVLLCREIVLFMSARGPGEGIAVFLGSYCFRAARDHFTIWTVISFVIILSCICFMCIVISMFSRQIVRSFVVREKKKMALQYELDFLKNQLSPHFLFNTLNNITCLIRIDPSLAESSMGKLSKLLRVMLYETSDKFIELKDDVDILLKYGELEKLRLSESFDFTFETKIEKPHCQIPPLLMMPLMENAMKHCVNPKGKSFAHVRINQSGNEIHFRAENSNFPRKSKPGASGLGLATFKKRLDLLFQGNYTYSTWLEGETYVSDLVIKLE